MSHIEQVEDGAALLSAVCAFIRRFCVFPSESALNAVTVWAAHTHMAEHFCTTPRLALLSPEPASGKTRVLEVLDLLVHDSMFSLNASAPAIFRTLAQRQVSLLVDEVDTVFAKRGKDASNEDLRAMFNAGYKRGATIPRCVRSTHDVQNFPVFCPLALAGLGDLPDTIMSRAVIVRMRRRAPGEIVDPFRARQFEGVGHGLRDRLARWAKSVGAMAGAAWPKLPAGIDDRPAEVWEPLIAIADAAGGPWPEVVRLSCVDMCKVAEDRRVSLGIRLLADLRIVFGDAIALHTETILARLCNGEPYGLRADAPWKELHGRSLSDRGLASMLSKYGVTALKVNIGGRALQGYRSEHLHDVWMRYLPSPTTAGKEPLEPAYLRPHEVLEVPEVPVPQANR